VIESWVVSFSLIVARVGTFVAILPLFGSRQAPGLVKVGLALGLASLWFGALGTAPAVEFPHGSATTLWLAYPIALGREAIIGAVLGYGFSLFLLPARIAGEFIGQEMGLALASLTDPSAESSATLLGQLFEIIGALVFFGLDGHHVWLAALHATFARWPIGSSISPLPVAPLVSGLTQAHEWGLLVAAPLAACLFVTSVLLALMARAAPQLNLLSVGFTLRLGVGLVAAVVFLPDLVAALGGVFGRLSELVYRFV
jgi:flagellar biosynthetic protein FliR